MKLNVKKGDFSRLGATKGRTWANFCLECRKESDCKVLIYERGKNAKPQEIAVPGEFSKGNLRAIQVDGLDLSEIDYNFWIDGKLVMDPYARRVVGREAWADESRRLTSPLRCRHEELRFSWRGEREKEIARTDMVLYKLHVRGFTMGMSEGTPGRGTFRGLTQKLSYLKSLGVTSVELMPVYEFEELIPKEESQSDSYARWKPSKKDKIKKQEEKPRFQINYWGYGEGMYFAPKASYAEGDSAALELKECILQMHKKGMECILEMDFSNYAPKRRILEALRHWVREYHVDGFHLQGDGIPLDLLLDDPYLGRTKIFYKGAAEHLISDEEKAFPRFFLDTDEFLYPCRKLACGIDGNIWELADQLKKQNEKIGYINYIADHNGFTLKDLFCYERKHNEANGENNADGLEWNYSNNCGVEGETTSRNVHKIRDRRMKNAAAMLFLAQGVPMLMAGDEDGNSQKGNNNAYCQDNPIGWKDWRQTGQDRAFLKYMKKLAAFRKAHRILRLEQPMSLMDVKSYGCPDLSYHEEDAWIPRHYYCRRSLGILYCGKYADEEEDVYVGFNFSDFQKNFALPKQKRGRKWHLVMDTAEKNAFLTEPEELKEAYYTIESHSVCILIAK